MTEGHSVFCNGKHHKMERFLEVCLLLLLYEEETGHGYGFIEQLSYFGFPEEQLNLSTLYRTLRKMEKEGSVVSFWEEGQGPNRRVYNITENGKKELNKWIQVLKGRKARIEKLINRYESFKIEGGEVE